MKLAITQIVLGILTIAALACPSPCSNAVLGAAVVVVGIVQLMRARKA